MMSQARSARSSIQLNVGGKLPRDHLALLNSVATYRERNMDASNLTLSKDIMIFKVDFEAKTIEREEEEIKKIYGACDVTLDPSENPFSGGLPTSSNWIQGRVFGCAVFVSGLDVSVNLISRVGSTGWGGYAALIC